jgi:hypothetical protein
MRTTQSETPLTIYDPRTGTDWTMAFGRDKIFSIQDGPVIVLESAKKCFPHRGSDLYGLCAIIAERLDLKHLFLEIVPIHSYLPAAPDRIGCHAIVLSPSHQAFQFGIEQASFLADLYDACESPAVRAHWKVLLFGDPLRPSRDDLGELTPEFLSIPARHNAVVFYQTTDDDLFVAVLPTTAGTDTLIEILIARGMASAAPEGTHFGSK